MKKNIVGLDLSINGSGCYFSNGNMHFHTSLKNKFNNMKYDNISYYTVDKFNKDGNEERYYNIALDIVNKCIENETEIAIIENFAYGYGHESPGRVFDISMCNGMICCLLIQNKIKIKKYAPKEIKKFATNSGNATKILMIEEFFKKNPISNLLEFIKEYKLNKYDSPISDIIDAYWLLQYYLSKD